jgi:hypothetical protein
MFLTIFDRLLIRSKIATSDNSYCQVWRIEKLERGRRQMGTEGKLYPAPYSAPSTISSLPRRKRATVLLVVDQQVVDAFAQLRHLTA